MGLKMLNLLPLPNEIHDPTNNQYNASNSAYESLPFHSRTSNTVRLDAGIERPHPRQLQVREGPRRQHQQQPVRAGVGGDRTTRCRDGSSRPAARRCCSSSIVNEVTVGYARNSYGFRLRDGRGQPTILATGTGRRSASTPRDSSHSVPTAILQGSATTRRTNIPYVPMMSFNKWAAAAALCSAATTLARHSMAAVGRCRPRTGTCGGRSRTTCRGRAAGTT